MYLIQKRSAVEAVYILMSVDGSVDCEEMTSFDEIGTAIDENGFASYKDELVASYEEKLQAIAGSEDRYDILSESVDAAIAKKADTCETGVPARMLVWNSLMMSYANGCFDPSERRLIRHIYRVTGIPESVYLEMEQLIKSYAAVYSTLSLMETSNLPYSQIKPMVKELEERKNTLTKCATELIADEVVNAPEPVIVKDDFVDKAVAAVKPKVDNAKKAAGKAWGDFKEKNAPELAEAKGQWELTKSEFRSLFKKKKKTEAAGEEPAADENAEGKEE